MFRFVMGFAEFFAVLLIVLTALAYCTREERAADRPREETLAPPATPWPSDK